MDKGFESFRLTFVVVVLLVVGFSGSVVFGGKDIELSQVPQVVRATIERELKDAEIDNLERDRDDGKTVYDVKAATEDNKDIGLKIAADGTVIKEKRELEQKDLPAAVVEAVKKSVGDFYYDGIEKRFERGRRIVYRIQGGKGDTEIEFKIAEDGTILDKDTKHNDDDDLPGNFREHRRLLLQLKDQLRLAAVGDSRVEKGIDPQYFYGEENRKYPTALNFGRSGASLELEKIWIEDYLKYASKLEWVIYGTSPRIFNRYFDSDRADDVEKSSVYRADRRGVGWHKTNTSPVPANAVDHDDMSPWGFDGDGGVDDDFRSDRDRRDKQRDLRKGKYRFDKKRLRIFESLIQLLAGRGVKMLAFTPPMHPLSIDQPCTDDDGTTREAYDELVVKLKALDAKYPNFYFLDVNNKGRHQFKPKEFNTFDHLNKKGAKKLTLMLNEFISKVDSQGKKKS